MKFIGLIVILAVSTTSGFTLNVTSADTRIVGGNQADIKDHKHLVVLMYQGSFICGGSLLSSQHVLTASHCVQHDPSNPSAFSIRAGSSNKNSGGTVAKVKTIWMHPKYDSETVDYDITMLKLAKTVSGSLIQPIALPTTQIAAGQNVIVAGWGATDKDGTLYPDIIRSTTMTVVGKAKCSSIWTYISARMLCAIKSGKGICFGDSGGPLAKDGVIYGVNSFVGECGSDYFPSVTANVLNMKPFITSKLSL